MRFSTKNFISVFAVGLLILAQGVSFVRPVFALTPPPEPCVPYNIDEKKVLKDVLNSPEMVPLASWKLIEIGDLQGDCAEHGAAILDLVYELPQDFSRLGIRYLLSFYVRVELDTGKADGDYRTWIGIPAIEIRNSIQSVEDNDRVKEFINKIGVEEATVRNYGYITYSNNSSGSSILAGRSGGQSEEGWTFSGSFVSEYTVPIDMTWQNFPEIDRLKSVFQKETSLKNCAIKPLDGKIKATRHEFWPGQEGWDIKGIKHVYPAIGAGWKFTVDVEGNGCPVRIAVDILDDGTQTITSLSTSGAVVPPKVEPPKETIQIKDSDDISALLIEQKIIKSVISIKLSEDQKQYTVIGLRSVKLFGFIPATMKIQLVVDAITGVVESTSKPWWAFLVRY